MPEEIAALYTRTSHEKDDAFSVDSQVKSGRQFAMEHKLTLPDDYVLREDFTGKTLDRPELSRLRSLIRDKKITAIIVYAVDRLARKIGVADLILDEIMDNGIKLYIVSWGNFVRDTPEDRLRFNFDATFSDFERRKIVERTVRGKREQIEQGIPVGSGTPLYGYRKVGKKKDTHYVIDEEQAEVVRSIFRWYAVERLSTTEIISRLAGVPTPGAIKGHYKSFTKRPSDEWPLTSIYKLLNDKTYIGSMPSYGSVIRVPAIVDESTFALAQERLQSGRQTSKRNTKYEYLMARRMRCRSCDYAIASSPCWAKGKLAALYYKCPSGNGINVKPKCGLPRFRVDRLDALVWEWVKELMLHPDNLRSMMEESQKEIQERNHELMYRLTRIEDRLAQEAQRLGVLLTEYVRVQTQPDSAAKRNMEPVYRQAKEDSERLFN
jgi:site-specific DNA recombinase